MKPSQPPFDPTAAALLPSARRRRRPPPTPATPAVPLDHPSPARPHRVYAALSNHCNRACPWCSTCSGPHGRTFLSVATLQAALPAVGPYELQLEGGEPMLHPQFWEFVAAARADVRCRRLVIATNGTCLPRTAAGLTATLQRLGVPLTIKLSWNHHLRDHDPGLLALATALRSALHRPGAGGATLFVLNVRLRRGVADDDAAVRAAVSAAGLDDVANVFYLERYGLAAGEAAWDEPAPVWGDFRLIHPDGADFGTDLRARSAAMDRLP